MISSETRYGLRHEEVKYKHLYLFWPNDSVLVSMWRRGKKHIVRCRINKQRLGPPARSLADQPSGIITEQFEVDTELEALSVMYHLNEKYGAHSDGDDDQPKVKSSYPTSNSAADAAA